MKKFQRFLSSLLAFVFSLTLVSGWSGTADAEENFSQANRYNVALVVDKSGSLRNVDGVGTDPDGLRFDALRLFLGLLTEKGNHVGLIAFDEAIRFDSGLQSISSMADKEALVEAAEVLGTSYDTDIGSAVLHASEMLSGMRESNGLPCVIMLLTDGMTDFAPDKPIQILKERSSAAAQKALEIAQKEGITIHGLLLNVDGRSINGEEEIRYFTDGTRGQLETVSSPEDLTAAFARFYSIINRTEYDGSHRIAFPEQGEVEARFPVPGFGAEEVNIVIECDHGSVRPEDICVIAPDGQEYGIEGHILETSRFLLLKIPEPQAGEWEITLKGNPGDTVDVCMIYNASMSVSLISDTDNAFEVLKPLCLKAFVSDTDGNVTGDRLKNIVCTLAVTDLSTGATTTYPMTAEDGNYSCILTFDQGGEYELKAIVDLHDFEVLSNVLAADIAVPSPTAAHDAVSDFTELGNVHDNLWELPLDGLFEDPKGGQFSYTLSDTLDGAAEIEDGILRVDLRKLGENASFSVLATDSYGLSAALPIDFVVSLPEATLAEVKSVSDAGAVTDNVWEVPLADLFDDPAGGGLVYTLDDPSGAAEIVDGVLRVKLGQPAAFSVTATDSRGLSTSLPFDLSVDLPEAKLAEVKSVSDAGAVTDNVWEVPLADLFDDPAGGGLAYTLNDPSGAAEIVVGVLRVKLGQPAAFSVTATDSRGLSTSLPFDLSVDLPGAKLAEVSSVSDAGAVTDNVWEVPLADLFDDPAGGGLAYTLNDPSGAAEIVDGVLRVKLGQPAAFSVTATDSRGLSTSLPFDLSVDLPEAKLERISDPFTIGQFRNNVWELDLQDCFESAQGADLTYAITGNPGDAVTIENNTLRVIPGALDGAASFSVTATDSNGLAVTLPFELGFTAPTANSTSLSLSDGEISGGNWALPLEGLFNDPAGQGLQYTLSDDFGGKVTIENSVLHADLSELGENTSFILTAADSLGQSSQLSVELTPAFPEAKSDQISDPLAAGRFENDYWELPLASLFDDPTGGDLCYSVSDDLGGKVTIEDNILRVRPEGDETAAFILTAENAQGLQAQLPFDLRFPAPAAKSDGISDAVKTGLFQKGSWELHLPELFEDPKQTSLEYSLSDDLGGAMKIEDETLQAECRGIGEADVTVRATDPLGLSAELPVKLVEQNMTWIILMIALLVLLLLIALFFLRKRAGRKR